MEAVYRPKQRDRIVVGLAKVWSCYGGPEEGGWDYEAGSPVGKYKVFFNYHKALEYRDYLEEQIAKRDKFPGVGVGGCGDNDDFTRGECSGNEGLKAVIQFYPRNAKGHGLEHWPKVTPRYE